MMQMTHVYGHIHMETAGTASFAPWSDQITVPLLGDVSVSIQMESPTLVLFAVQFLFPFLDDVSGSTHIWNCTFSRD